jgi:hypothetical protein
MAKFKVGDFVTSEGWTRAEGHEIVDIKGGYYYIGAVGGNSIPYEIVVWDNTFILVKNDSPKSPIVETTVKSVAPGNYGIVRVVTGQIFDMDLMNQEKYINVHVVSINPTIEELESAAKIFMELAEYLKEKNNG